jgi:hypothetical protein
VAQEGGGAEDHVWKHAKANVFEQHDARAEHWQYLKGQVLPSRMADDLV